MKFLCINKSKIKIYSVVVAVACAMMAGCGSRGAESTGGETAPGVVSDEKSDVVTDAGSDDSSSLQDVEDEVAEVDDVSEEEEDETSDVSDDQTQDQVPVLRDSMRESLGAFAGCAVTGFEADDPGVWNIITTHFEAVTLGNELKPDALVGYSNSRCPGTYTDELDGEEIEVPKLDHSRADKILDKILAWNEEHPEKSLVVRGHVLVWHSQTPEWFFHEDYDKEKPYVTPEVMNKRLEWYIRTVLTYYTGEDSKYKGLFYGWDVVNEAVSDSTGTYRSDAERSDEPLSNDTHGSNSSWWHVYQSNEYIINAFKYANKYAPEDLELYYNDYNECQINKRNGIIELLKSIKAEEGAPGEGTRISAMGMQGHYSMDNPSATDIQNSIQSYSDIVGKVQFTELDLRASDDYDGSDESKVTEYEKQRKRYNMIRFAVQSAETDKEPVVAGITFWGTVDHYSWLQFSSNVGGGADGAHPQCPLLFDDKYEPKPSFYVFAGQN